MQLQLQAIYEVDVPYAVADFVTHDANLAGRNSSRTTLPRESLLIAHTDDTLDVALYLDADVIQGLRADSPLTRLHNGNLQSYCLAAEGVSHFLYLIWRAAMDTQVSCAELELQAEVDKFVCAWLLLERQVSHTTRSQLRTSLFQNVSYAQDMTRKERQRYEMANRLAAKYCRHLDRQYLNGGRLGDFFAEIRRFYRLHHQGKIRYAEQISA